MEHRPYLKKRHQTIWFFQTWEFDRYFLKQKTSKPVISSKINVHLFPMIESELSSKN